MSIGREWNTDEYYDDELAKISQELLREKLAECESPWNYGVTGSRFACL